MRKKKQPLRDRFLKKNDSYPPVGGTTVTHGVKSLHLPCYSYTNPLKYDTNMILDEAEAVISSPIVPRMSQATNTLDPTFPMMQLHCIFSQDPP